MTTPQTTAGTAADGYRVDPLPHLWTPVPPDVYERARCQHCGKERHGIPTQRTGSREP